MPLWILSEDTALTSSLGGKTPSATQYRTTDNALWQSCEIAFRFVTSPTSTVHCSQVNHLFLGVQGFCNNVLLLQQLRCLQALQ